GEKVCNKLSLAALVGKSPWLVMGVGGAVQYFNTPDERKEKLGAFAQPWAWGSMLVLVLLVAFKDSILTVFSSLKMPLDALAEAFHAVGGVFGIAYLGASAFGTDPSADPDQIQGLLPDNTAAPVPTLLDQAGSFVLWLLMCGVHAAVWIVFNSIEVAILLNPIPFVDTCLKAFRTAIIGVISGAAAIHPVLGFLVALPIILGSVLLVPVALRFAIAGGVFTADVFKRLFGVKPKPGAPVRAFAALGFPGVRLYTFGTVERGQQGLEFVYRFLFVLWKRRVPIPMEKVAVASGGVLPRLMELGEGGRTWLRFPPRYRRQEGELALALGLGDVVHHSVGQSLGKAWRRLTEWVSGKPTAEGTA
ncbi:MAG: hypothetical protein MUF18_19325, partial [Fimbriiglobus sp.]|nr:hypothetical protein [Fimbriiglobus sp.]